MHIMNSDVTNACYPYRPRKWPSGIGLNNYSYVVDSYVNVSESVATYMYLVVQSKYNQSRSLLYHGCSCRHMQSSSVFE